jgi:hypothetical protein
MTITGFMWRELHEARARDLMRDAEIAGRWRRAGADQRFGRGRQQITLDHADREGESDDGYPARP